jgi:hypothetical protein
MQGDAARTLARHLPPALRQALKRATGLDGSPAEEPAPEQLPEHVERFLAAHAADVRGEVLSTRPREGAYVVSADPRDPHVTVVADLAEPGSLPPSRFDCVILTEGLGEPATVGDVLANAMQALAAGGVLLACGAAVAADHLHGVELVRGPGSTCARAVKAS